MISNMKALQDLFFLEVRKHPNNTAVVYTNMGCVRKITYDEILTEIWKISSCLRSLNVHGYIGVLTEPDLGLPTLILTILHLDLSFTFIDMNKFDVHKSSILKSLEVAWLFTNKEYVRMNLHHNILSEYGIVVQEIFIHNALYELWHLKSFDRTCTDNQKSNLMAYAIQTSGSTGEPKIVQVPHQCILPNVLDLSDILHIEESDMIFLGTPLTFDPSIVELFLPFRHGASLLIVSSVEKASPHALLDILFPTTKEFYSGVSVVQMTPSVVGRWRLHDMKSRVLSENTTLKALLLGGEPCPSKATLKQWKSERNKTKIYNLYGITEVSCWASIEVLDFDETSEGGGDITLGKPLSNTMWEVRDTLNQPIKEGEGELFIGSRDRICLVGRESQDMLCPPVFRRTGDIVKLDGNHKSLCFIGRKDRVIKRWGHRLSLLEVENIVSSHPNVNACCCVWDQTSHCLGLALVLKEGEVGELQSHFIQTLPKATVPDVQVVVEALPLTDHGKVNLDILHDMVFNRRHGDEYERVLYSPLYLMLHRAWKKFLGQDPEPHDTFVNLGGNSFLALQMSLDLQDKLIDNVPKEFISMLLGGDSFLKIYCYLQDNSAVKDDCVLSIASTDPQTDEQSLFQKTVSHMETGSVGPLIGKTFKEDGFQKRKSLHHVSDITVKKQRTDEQKVNEKAYIKEQEHEHQEIQLKSHCSSTYNKDSQNDVAEDKVVRICCRGRDIRKTTVYEAADFQRNSGLCMVLEWKFNFSKCIDASPCYIKFSSGRCWVIVGSHSHRLAVLNTVNGTAVSISILPDRIESNICPSPCGSLGVIGCYNGCIYCLTLNTGEIIWSFSTRGLVKCSPVLCLEGTAVVVGSYDGVLYCISLKSGALIWQRAPGTGSIYASPCVSNTCTVFVGALDGTCASICEKTGVGVWNTKLSSPVFSSPAFVAGLEAFVIAEVTGIVHCFEADSGVKLWTYHANGNIFSSLTTTGSEQDKEELVLFGCHDKNVYCLKCREKNDVALNWKQELDSAVYATPFAASTQGMERQVVQQMFALSNCIVAASTQGTVYILDKLQGLVKSMYKVPGEVFSSPVLCDGKVFVGCRDNNLYCLNTEIK